MPISKKIPASVNRNLKKLGVYIYTMHPVEVLSEQLSYGLTTSINKIPASINFLASMTIRLIAMDFKAMI